MKKNPKVVYLQREHPVWIRSLLFIFYGLSIIAKYCRVLVIVRFNFLQCCYVCLISYVI